MMAVLREEFGNPSSVHHFGQRAKSVVDEARSAVAELIGGDPSEVIFTSGGPRATTSPCAGAAEALEPSGGGTWCRAASSTRRS
jgi:cysteine desulfurase